jgi:hypothetical protein
VLCRELPPDAGGPRRIWPVYPRGRTKSMARCIANSRVDGPLYRLAEGGAGDLRSDMSMGDRLKVARRAAGLTQEQLAERASVNVDTIRG